MPNIWKPCGFPIDTRYTPFTRLERIKMQILICVGWHSKKISNDYTQFNFGAVLWYVFSRCGIIIGKLQKYVINKKTLAHGYRNPHYKPETETWIPISTRRRLVTARFVTRFNLWLRHDLWPHNASICDPARFVTKSASICDQRYTMILESNLCRGKLVFVFTLIMYTKWYNMMIYIWIMI